MHLPALVVVIGIQDELLVQPIQEHKYAVQAGEKHAGWFFAVSQKKWAFWLGKKIVLFFDWRQMRQMLKQGEELRPLQEQQQQGQTKNEMKGQTKSEMKNQRSQMKNQRNQMKSQRNQMKSQRNQMKNQRNQMKSQRNQMKNQRNQMKSV